MGGKERKEALAPAEGWNKRHKKDFYAIRKYAYVRGKIIE